jgi:rare lipoprotein A
MEPSMRRIACLLIYALLLAGCSSLDRGVNRPSAPAPSATSRHYSETGQASYYGARHHGKRTASGEHFDQNSLSAAHRTLPFGTQVRVTNLANQHQVVVTINDRGPVSRRRLIDVSKKAAEALGMLDSGVAKVRVETLD